MAALMDPQEAMSATRTVVDIGDMCLRRAAICRPGRHGYCGDGRVADVSNGRGDGQLSRLSLMGLSLPEVRRSRSLLTDGAGAGGCSAAPGCC